MLYFYSARSAEGVSLEGSLEAASLDQAVAHLRSRALFITDLERGTTLRGLARALLARLRRHPRAREGFFRSLAVLLGAGVDVHRALLTVADDCPDGALAESLRSLCGDVDRGESFAQAAARHPQEFSEVVLALLRAGETHGGLDRALFEAAKYEERNTAMRQRVRAALAYPMMVCAAAGVLIVGLLVTTMPAFAGLFAQLNVPLPPLTRGLLAVGRIARDPLGGAAALVAFIAATIGVGALRRSSRRVKVALDAALLRTPGVGKLCRRIVMARFSRSLGVLLAGGVDLTIALDGAIDTLGNAAYETQAQAVRAALRRGETLAQAFERAGCFDAIFLQIVRVGEESGHLDGMCLHLAEQYEREIELLSHALSTAIEPLLICCLGAAIGTIVAAIIIPLYSMIGSIR